MLFFFNVSTLGSRGKPYPAISNMTTTHDVRKMRPDIKILTGHDYKDMAFHLSVFLSDASNIHFKRSS